MSDLKISSETNHVDPAKIVPYNQDKDQAVAAEREKREADAKAKHAFGVINT